MGDFLLKYVKDIINNPKNDIFVSAVSLWEIALKNDSHQELMPFSAKDVVNVMDDETDFQMIDIHYDAFLYLNDFSKQNIHHDPFDHLLLSIAKIEDFSLITCDKNMKKYQGVKIIGY